MAISGWCLTGHHGFVDDTREYGLCPKDLGGAETCSCECHSGKEMRRAPVYVPKTEEEFFDDDDTDADTGEEVSE